MTKVTRMVSHLHSILYVFKILVRWTKQNRYAYCQRKGIFYCRMACRCRRSFSDQLCMVQPQLPGLAKLLQPNLFQYLANWQIMFGQFRKTALFSAAFEQKPQNVGRLIFLANSFFRQAFFELLDQNFGHLATVWTACSCHDQLLPPSPPPPASVAPISGFWGRWEVVCVLYIYSLVYRQVHRGNQDEKFGQTKNHDIAFHSKWCLVYACYIQTAPGKDPPVRRFTAAEGLTLRSVNQCTVLIMVLAELKTSSVSECRALKLVGHHSSSYFSEKLIRHNVKH